VRPRWWHRNNSRRLRPEIESLQLLITVWPCCTSPIVVPHSAHVIGERNSKPASRATLSQPGEAGHPETGATGAVQHDDQPRAGVVARRDTVDPAHTIDVDEPFGEVPGGLMPLRANIRSRGRRRTGPDATLSACPCQSVCTAIDTNSRGQRPPLVASVYAIEPVGRASSDPAAPRPSRSAASSVSGHRRLACRGNGRRRVRLLRPDDRPVRVHGRSLVAARNVLRLRLPSLPVPRVLTTAYDGRPSRAWMSWSSGKDSAFALHTTRQASEVEVVGLLTTVNAAAERVAMHAVRRVLLEAQADRLGLPLRAVEIPSPARTTSTKPR